MNSIRVLIAEMPQLVTDIAQEAIERQPDMEVVGVVRDPGELRTTVTSTEAEVLLCPTGSGELPAVYRELFDSHPRLRLLALEPDGRSGGVYELRPTRTPLDVWPDGLVEAIRVAGNAPSPFSRDEAIAGP